MRTARFLTVSQHALGGVPARGVPAWGGVPSGGYLPRYSPLWTDRHLWKHNLANRTSFGAHQWWPPDVTGRGRFRTGVGGGRDTLSISREPNHDRVFRCISHSISNPFSDTSLIVMSVHQEIKRSNFASAFPIWINSILGWVELSNRTPRYTLSGRYPPTPPPAAPPCEFDQNGIPYASIKSHSEYFCWN